MYSVDKSGVKTIILNFYQQIEQALHLYQQADVRLDTSRIRNIVYLGMGGSAIAGDLLYDVLFDELKVPLDVVRGYFAPAHCDENTLVIVSSYSGNTEETLSAVEFAAQKNPQVVAITSGGQLAEKAQKQGWPTIRIPEGYPPRQALGFLFFPLYHMLGHAGLLLHYQQDLRSLIRYIKNESKRYEYPKGSSHKLPLDLAHTFQNKIPLFYSTAPYLRTVSRRWQNQMQENAKSMAFSNVLPEMNHNEIVGWEQAADVIKEFVVVFLENENPHPRIKKRIELTQQIIRDRGVQVVDIYSKGDSMLERVFSLILLGDWVSYYLALSYKKDPIKIANIDFLKKELAKYNG